MNELLILSWSLLVFVVHSILEIAQEQSLERSLLLWRQVLVQGDIKDQGSMDVCRSVKGQRT